MISEIKQGEIYWADLSPSMGHEQNGMRPVLILQNNILNKNLNTVIIAPITTNMAAKGLLTTYFLSAEKCGLSRDSVALLSQIRCIDKIRLVKVVGSLTIGELTELLEKMMMVF